MKKEAIEAVKESLKNGELRGFNIQFYVNRATDEEMKAAGLDPAKDERAHSLGMFVERQYDMRAIHTKYGGDEGLEAMQKSGMTPPEDLVDCVHLRGIERHLTEAIADILRAALGGKIMTLDGEDGHVKSVEGKPVVEHEGNVAYIGGKPTVH